jgi:hypothetical protein
MKPYYSMDEWDVRNTHKKSLGEIKEWVKKLPCAICGSIPACGCTPGTRKKRSQVHDNRRRG